MVRGNNMIPNNHFHKDWQKRVKTWFGQPLRKKRRARLRRQKAKKSVPNPPKLFHPDVRCPTVRYNGKLKLGRGFSLRALKSAKMAPRYARSIGIAVDPRRSCKSIEQLRIEIDLLEKYRKKLIKFKKGFEKPRPSKPKLDARVITEEEKMFSAVSCLRKARKAMKCPKKKNANGFEKLA